MERETKETTKTIKDNISKEANQNTKITTQDNNKGKNKEPLIYKIPYGVMSHGLILIWLLVGGYLAEYVETSPLSNLFQDSNFLLAMLLSLDTIICLGIWFIYMGYFYNRSKRILFLILIVVIYMIFYLFMRQY